MKTFKYIILVFLTLFSCLEALADGLMDDRFSIQVLSESDLVLNAQLLSPKLSNGDGPKLFEAVSYFSNFLAANRDLFPDQKARDRVTSLLFANGTPRQVVITVHLLRLQFLEKSIQHIIADEKRTSDDVADPILNRSKIGTLEALRLESLTVIGDYMNADK